MKSSVVIDLEQIIHPNLEAISYGGTSIDWSGAQSDIRICESHLVKSLVVIDPVHNHTYKFKRLHLVKSRCDQPGT